MGHAEGFTHHGPSQQETPRAPIAVVAELAGALDRAIARSELKLVFQPQICSSTGRIASAEALLRWQHHRYGWIAPDRIMDMASEVGRCEDLTRSIINDSLAFARTVIAGDPTFSIAINIPPCLVVNAEFPRLLGDAVETSQVPSSNIVLEITEQAMVTDAAVIETLRSSGYGIAIDDFGRGYSSLNYLRAIPATQLKVDRVFVQRARQSDRDRRLLGMLIEMAHLYGMTAVAEGVERAELQTTAIKAGCDLLQGWHVGQPMSATDFHSWLSAWTPWPIPVSRHIHPIAWR